jgi:DNA-binding NtrC family response regulator
VSEKKFREDLYYRLNVIHIAIPPLRERREDVRPLVQHFLLAASDVHRVPMPALSEETLAHLEDYHWPGNVRELKNIAERLVIRARGNVVSVKDLPAEIVSGRRASPTAVPTVSVASRLYDRMIVDGDTFWSVVYEPFMCRDITRDDLRELVSRGLEQTKGSYKTLLELFNIQPGDYKKLLAFLRKHECHLPFQKFRMIAVRPESVGGNAARLRDTPADNAANPSYTTRTSAGGSGL